MFEANVTVNNASGLHARPASALVQCCQKFQSEISIVTGNGELNAKSILSILSGGIHRGTEILLKIEGPDEQSAGQAVVDLIQNLQD